MRAPSSRREAAQRIAIVLEDDLFLVLHLMIAGRLHWKAPGAKGGRKGLAVFQFPNGVLTLTEAGTKRRASLYIVRGRAGLEPHSRGGLEVFEASRDEFVERMRSESHTVKRSLTDPRLFSGIGNAYSDEILHRARLSPVKLTGRLTDEEITRLYDATRAVLTEWIDRMRAEVGEGFPEKVTAFRDEMAVHGKFGQPCPVCGTPVQRVRYADKLASIIPNAAVIFLIAIEYPHHEISGPPFAVSPGEVERLYGKAFTIKVLETRDGLAGSGNLKQRGVSRVTETAYLLRRR